MATNIWRRFEELVKPPAEEVVTITTVNADGTVTAQTMAGGTVRLRCAISVAAGDRVFAANKEVRAKAPSLDYYELEV